MPFLSIIIKINWVSALSKEIIKANLKSQTKAGGKMKKNGSLTKPVIGIIANSTSLKNREDLIKELGEPENGFFKPLKFTYRDLEGEIIPLDIQPNEILQTAGFKKSKKAMLKAVNYLVERGAKVICFTASTKRLPGKSGKEIKKLYPEQIFSIGDNATIISFKFILEQLLASLDKENDHVACVGAGFIGEQAIASFIDQGFKNISVVSKYANNLPASVKVLDEIKQLPSDIKLMAACSHKYQPDVSCFKYLFTPRAFIIDVSVPPMVGLELYQSLHLGTRRFDAGDFFLKNINYEFPPETLGFPEKGFWFGCFSEAIMLTLAHVHGLNLESYDFFSINEKSQKLLYSYLKKEKVQIPFINFFDSTASIRRVSL